MTTLVLAEVHGTNLNEATAKAVAAASSLNAPVHVLVAGEGVRGAAEAAAKLQGVEKVLLADGSAYAHQLAEPRRLRQARTVARAQHILLRLPRAAREHAE